MELSQPGSPEEWVVSWNGEDGVYQLALPEGRRHWSGGGTLHLRAFVDPLSGRNPEDQTQAFSLRLTDGLGARAVVPVADEEALAYPYGATLVFDDKADQVPWGNNVLLSSIRVPLAGFAGVDLGEFESIALVFDRTDSGDIFLADLELLE